MSYRFFKSAPAPDDRDERIEELDRRVAELESRTPMFYDGVFSGEKGYSPGACVTHAGSLWFCKAATSDRPGTSSAWQLIVKRGKDERKK